jgi:hypothetical protein
MLFTPFAHILDWAYVSSLWLLNRDFYICWNKSLITFMICKIFCHSANCLSLPCWCPSKLRVFDLNTELLNKFCFVVCSPSVVSKKCSPDPRSQRFTPSSLLRVLYLYRSRLGLWPTESIFICVRNKGQIQSYLFLILILICISLMTYEVRHLFIYLLVIRIFLK